MRTLLFVGLFAFIATPALSQGMGTAIPLNQEKQVDPDTAAKRRATEEAYRSTIRNIPEVKANDPWGNMRSVDTSTPNANKGKAPKKTN
jgi:hypothetical protein